MTWNRYKLIGNQIKIAAFFTEFFVSQAVRVSFSVKEETNEAIGAHGQYLKSE